MTDLWNSYERMNGTFRRSRDTAIVAGFIAMAGWLWPAPLLAVPATVIATTAVLFALFSWFRKDDLSRDQR